MAKCSIIEVKRSHFGHLMYLSEALAFVLLLLYLVNDESLSIFPGFAAKVNAGSILIALFALIGASVILGFVDLGKTGRKVESIILSGKDINRPPKP
jgi:hypothetical protein